jgi:transcription initiation factor TFIIIB Brf1 subunit/transcription initiation factor TFIIB
MIEGYHQLDLNHLLKEIAEGKGVSIPELFKRLQEKGYYLNIESLYRYLSSSQKSKRLPPQEFIPIFAEALQLTDQQTRLMLQFWRHYKLMQKCDCDRQ